MFSVRKKSTSSRTAHNKVMYALQLSTRKFINRDVSPLPRNKSPKYCTPLTLCYAYNKFHTEYFEIQNKARNWYVPFLKHNLFGLKYGQMGYIYKSLFLNTKSNLVIYWNLSIISDTYHVSHGIAEYSFVMWYILYTLNIALRFSGTLSR